MKRIIACLICLSILLSTLSSCEIRLNPGLKFTREGDSYTVEAKLLRAGDYVDLVSPEKHRGLPVTKIADDGFSYCTRLKTVVIPDSVTEIGASAFKNCEKLTKVTLSNNITELKVDTFRCCDKLMNVKLPENLKKISAFAFHDCDSLTSITIPASVETIISGAFSNCDSLFVVYNNSSIDMTIETDSAGSVARRAVMLFQNGTVSYMQDGYDYMLKDDVFLFSHKEGKYYLMAYIGDEETVTLPIDINGNKYDIYRLKGVVNVIIPESIDAIPQVAFYKCLTLKSVVIPDGVTTIGREAFAYCEDLRTVVVPESVKKLGSGTYRTQLVELHLSTRE